jgi:hypothetical protein
VARPSTPVGPTKTAAPSADHVKRLEALRDRLATAIEGAGNRELAPLAARYQSVLAELATMTATTQTDGLDDLAKRRQRRRAASKAH